MRLVKSLVAAICLTCSIAAVANIDLKNNVAELEKNGYTVVKNVFNATQIAQLQAAYLKQKDIATHVMAVTPSKPRQFNENNSTNASKYWKTDTHLILQGGLGRYDLYQGFSEGILASDQVLHNPKLERLMQMTMSDEFTSYAGIILSGKGSADQYWHRDTHTLANEGTDGSQLVELDDFYFTILIPLTVSFTLENGTTEFLAGSHRLSAHDFATGKLAQVPVPLGSALVFNGKINHRGKANNSNADRPALYVVYHKKWYNDQYRNGVN